MPALRTLGELRLTGPTGEMLAGRRKELVLLAYLARRSPRPVRRDELVGLLWSDSDETHARQSLRQALLRLRRAIGDGLLVSRDTVQLTEGVIELDVPAFEHELAAGRPAAAIDRWRGEFLAGTEDAGGEAYRTWLDGQRATLRGRLRAAFEQVVTEAAAGGDWAESSRWAQRWAEWFPHDENAHLHWIEALYGNGRADEARALQANYTGRLRRELGATPSREFGRTLQHLEETTRAAALRSAGPGSAAVFTPDLVGRELELRVLESAWGEVEAGGAATLIIEGDEGVGKTLLAEMFLQSLEGHGETGGRQQALTLRARARAEMQSGEWETARSLLAPIADAPALGGVSERSLADVSGLVPALRTRFPRLPDPMAGQRPIIAAVMETLATVADEVPVVVFIDDLPDSDPATAELVAALARQRPARVLLLVTARTGSAAAANPLPAVWALPGVRRIMLRPLSAADIERLVASTIALSDDARSTLAARLYQETGGNPFFATEIVSAMVDEGDLVADSRGLWRIAAELQGRPLPLPTSVRDAIARRLRRLSEPARELARQAAASEPCGRAALRRLSDLSVDEFDAGLDELIARRLLRPVAADVPGEEALEFTHAIIGRVARELLATDHGQTVRVQWWRTRRAAAAVLVLLSLGAVAAAATVGRSRAAARPVLAVGEIVERGASDTADIAGAVGDMLATNLARLPKLTVVSNARMHEVMALMGGGQRSQASWGAAARRAGAAELLEGSLHRTAGGFRLDLRRVDVRSGRVRAGYTVEGTDPFEVVDRATSEIAAGFGLERGRLHVADVTTTSLVAYRFYEEGLRSYAVADYNASRRLFDAAVAEDSNFAMAAHYALLSRVNMHQTEPPGARDALIRVAERASDRERLLIRGRWTAFAGRATLALAETLAIRYPAEPDGYLLLGSALAQGGDFVAAIPYLERVIVMDSLGLAGADARCRACDALEALGNAYLAADSGTGAERIARRWLRLQPQSGRALHALGRSLNAQGRHDEAAAARRAARATGTEHPYDLLYPALTHIYAGNFAQADALLHQLADAGPGDIPENALWFLALSLRNQGRLEEALAVTDRFSGTIRKLGTESAQLRAQILLEMGKARDAARIFDAAARTTAITNPSPAGRARHQAWNLTHAAGAWAAAGDTIALRALVESIETTGRQSGYGRDWRLHHHARGLLLVARGELEPAATEFRRAIYSPTHGYTRTNLELGRVLLALNRPHEAVAALQPALRGDLEASNFYVTRTELHELLGRAWEAAGSPDSAATHYRQVLSAWRVADAKFESRRERVRARLKSAIGG